jgi:O-antigen/teichoic acid export membrane protein
MSARGYGNFAFAVAVLGVALVVADGGFTRLLIRDIARLGGNYGQTITRLLAVRSVWIGVVVATLVVAQLTRVLDVRGALLAVLAGAAALETLANGFEAAAVGAEAPWRVAGGQLLSSAILIGYLPIILVVQQPSAALALLGVVIASTTRAAWQVFAWHEELSIRDLGLRQHAVGAIRQALPYLLVTVLGTIYYRIDIVILHAIRGPIATAPYAAAYRIVDLSIMLGGIAAATISPHLSRIHAMSRDQVWSEWRRYTAAVALVAVPACIVIAVFAYPLAGLLFGRRYEASSGLALRLLTIGMPFMLLQIINAVVLFTGDDQRSLIRLSVPTVLMNIGLTWWLVDLSGSSGAAAATSVSEIVTFIYFAIVIYRRLR